MNLTSYMQLNATGRPLQGRTKFQGLDISIENKAGSVRKGKNKDGTPWQTHMRFPYGYILRSEGVDGDHVDCFVGPIKNAKFAYIVHAKNPSTMKYDEDKVMLGFDSAKTAKKVFLQHYDNPKFFGSMDQVPMDDFIKKVHQTKQKPSMITALAATIELYLWAEANRTVCMDFDNTLAHYTEWKGATSVGAPIKAGVRLLRLLQKSGFKVVVLTARQKSSFPAIKKWLAKNGFSNVDVTNVKPPAMAYIDDKAVEWPKKPSEILKKLIKKSSKNGLQAFNESLQPFRMTHMDPIPLFHPPSLKNPQHVPTDNPNEKDDRFLDVTKRKSKDGQRYRNELSRRNNIPPFLPARTTPTTFPIG